MSNFDGGRLGMSPFYNPDDVQNPFRGVFTEGLRQTGVDAAEALTESRMRDEGRLGEREWKTPVAGVEGGALAQGFGDYRMTPESPSVRESQHWDFYQPEMSGQEAEAVPQVDPIQDPAGALGVSTAVRAKMGGGMGTVKYPEAPTMKQITSDLAEQEGKQVMFDQNKIPAWQDSKAFGQGLLSFGLNLLSGNDWATSFNQASNHFNQAFGREKREMWAQDLAAQGYDAHEIQAWIESGDQKALTDPMAKKMQQQAYKLGQYNLQKAEYESSPEYQAYKRENEQFDRKLRVAEMEQNQAYRNAQLGISQAELALKQQAAQAKAAAEGKTDKVQPRDALLAAQQLSTDLELANQPVPTVGGLIASGVKGLLGQEAGSHLLKSGAGASWAPDANQADKIRMAQDQFTENAVRLATGAVVKAEEQEKFRSYLFPQGNEFNDPKIVARKRATQDVFNTVTRNIALGKTKAMDPSTAMYVAADVSSGKAVPLKDQSGMVVGLRYANGTIRTF